MSLRVVVEADGGSRGNPGPAGYGAVVLDAATGEVLAEVAESIGVATNNVAEYRGILAGLRRAAELGATSAEVRMDSKLVVEQMSGRWQIKHPDLRPLAMQVREAVRRVGDVRFGWIPRERNSYADRLANEAMDDAAAGRPWTPRVVEVPGVGSVTGRGGTVATPAGGDSGGGTLETPAPNRLSGWMSSPTPPTTTVLLRHGETALSVEKRFSGLGEHPLTRRGRAQATAAAARLALAGGIDALVSSPIGRARATADTVAAALGLPVAVDDGLRETDFGDWEGYTFTEVQHKWPDELAAWLADPDVAPPAGESFAATTRRVRQARDRVLAAHPGGRVLLVSHVTPIKTLVRIALDAPASTLYRLHLDLACLSEIDWYADGPAVLRLFNDTAHLVGITGVAGA